MDPAARTSHGGGMDPITNGVLTQIGKAKAWLATFDGPPEDLADARDQASAWVEFFKHCRSGLDAQNTAAELKIQLERELGARLPEPAPPGRPSKLSGRARLPDGIDRRLAARLRSIASVPEGELIAYFHTCREEGLEITSAGVERLWRALNRKVRDGETVSKEVQPDRMDAAPELSPADAILADLTRLTRKITLWINSPDGAKFKDYLLACKLGHFLDSRDITVRLDDGTLKTLPVRWRGFGGIRQIIRKAAQRGKLAPEQVRQWLRDAMRDDPDAGVWPGDLAEGEVPE